MAELGHGPRPSRFDRLARYEALVSIEYFQASVWGAARSPRPRAVVRVTEDIPEGAILIEADGSYTLDEIVRAAGVTTFPVVRPEIGAGRQYMDLHPAPEERTALFDPARFELLEAIVRSLQDDGVEVRLFVPPYVDIDGWQVILRSYQILYEEVVERTGIDVIGSPFGPEFGCLGEEYWIIDHPREAAVARVFEAHDSARDK